VGSAFVFVGYSIVAIDFVVLVGLKAEWVRMGAGKRWETRVDLWTLEEGRSDLVLDGCISETEAGPSLTIHLAYVP
jgi:hypothetical protein